jgi:hypothetical protein
MPVALEVACRDRTFTILNRLDGGGDAPSFRLPDGSTLEARAAVLERTGSGGVSRGYRLDPGDAGAVRPGPSPATERTCRVARVDYEKGIVAVTGRMPGSIPAGGIAIVESAGHADAVRVARILGDSEFSTGDEDLFAGTVHVSSADGREIDFLPRHLYFLQPGMTVVNEDGRVVGRIRSVRHGRMTLESPVAPESFPDRNGDGRRTCRIAVIGPGDRIRLHASERWGADPR